MDTANHKSEDILPKLKSDKLGILVVRLNPGDRAWNPASTQYWNQLRGPAKVTYRRFEDGGIKAEVEPLEISAELRDAITEHYIETGKSSEPADLASRLGVSASTIYKRLRTLNGDVDGCNSRQNHGVKVRYFPTIAHLRKLLLAARGQSDEQG